LDGERFLEDLEEGEAFVRKNGEEGGGFAIVRL
jgi:hypothetical protein